MKLFYQCQDSTLYHGDCLEVLKALPDASVDAIVTDPPAGIGFMGKEWDDFRRARNANDAGRNNVFGRTSRSGPEYGRRGRDAFIGFMTDVMAECLRVAKPGTYALIWSIPRTSHWTGMAIEDAGWTISDRISHLFGSGFPKHKSKLKPACEDWWLAWKPDRRATPLNIDACRIPVEDADYAKNCAGNRGHADNTTRSSEFAMGAGTGSPLGRWPAHLVLDTEAAALLDEQTGILESNSGEPFNRNTDKHRNSYARFEGRREEDGYYGDSGGASRFFYCPKAPKSDRGEGNKHPTVKNTELMRWLCRLITPKGGTVLDPFGGSGSTGVAAFREGFKFIGIERESEYIETAKRRLEAEREEMGLFGGAAA